MTRVTMTVNGRAVGPHDVADTLPMVDYLNDVLGLTGTKFGCGIGVCHACVVIVDEADGTSRTERTCIAGATSFAGRTIRTVEGHANGNTPSPVQSAFLDHFAFQCGYCTPGFVNAATVLVEALKATPVARKDVEPRVEKALGAHICRCSGYVRYHEALKALVLSDPSLLSDG